MCGVFGYIGERDAIQVCLRGLEQLEYRGYDSTGIASIHNGKIIFCKRAGKLSQLKKTILEKEHACLFTPTSMHSAPKIAIAHTRWATHGKVTDENAHPHFDSSRALAIIHNGIIENYDTLKAALEKQGVLFSSETDTEVIAQLIAQNYQGDLAHALHQTLHLLKGSFAIVAIHKNHPNLIVAAARECPISIALNLESNETIISSDPNTLIGTSFNVIFLSQDEVACVKQNHIEIYNAHWGKLEKKGMPLQGTLHAPSKEGFEHFMLKELFEQPAAIQRTIFGRFKNDIIFEELPLPSTLFQKISKIWILGCGTSAHAGSIGSLFFEDLAHVEASCEISSEARYRDPLLSPETLIVAISQSGETADTLAAIRATKQHGCKTIGICNVQNSALPREADGTIFLKAGPEISVCSTKAFTSQLAILLLLALFIGRAKNTVSLELSINFYNELQKIPHQIQQILHRAAEIHQLAKKYAKYNNFLFMGRRYMLPTCMEAALKLKEISYTNANGCSAGELKHGPIALLDNHFPVIAFCSNKKTESKIASNLMEVKARGAPVLAIAPEHMQSVRSIVDDVLFLPTTCDELAPFLSTVASQLFAYYIAKERGCDIDQPRNLAKSVTVE